MIAGMLVSILLFLLNRIICARTLFGVDPGYERPLYVIDHPPFGGLIWKFLILGQTFMAVTCCFVLRRNPAEAFLEHQPISSASKIVRVCQP